MTQSVFTADPDVTVATRRLRHVLLSLSREPNQPAVTVERLVRAAGSRVVAQCSHKPYPVERNTRPFGHVYTGTSVLCGLRWRVGPGQHVTLMFWPRGNGTPERPNFGVIDVACDADPFLASRLIVGLASALELEGVPA